MNSYSGSTTVSAGTLDLEPGVGFNEINQTTFNISSGATLGLFGYIDKDGTTISGAGAANSTLGGFTPPSGNGSDTPLFIYKPANETATGAAPSPTPFTVSVSDLTITNGLSQGGNSSGGVGGGGGAGLGGGAFVGAGATLVLSNVDVTGNTAAGGAGVQSVGGGGGGRHRRDGKFHQRWRTVCQ